MADYSIEQLWQALINAGMQPAEARTLAAVSLAENSSRSLGARNTSAIEDSAGPFQINLRAHPQYTLAQVTNLDSAAKAAKEIYDSAGHSFTPWSMFTNGGYISHLPEVDTAASNVLHGIANGIGSLGSGSIGLPSIPSLNPADAISGALKPIIDIIKLPIELLVKMLTFVTTEKHWWQMGFIFAGLGMIIAGLAVFFKNEIESVASEGAKGAEVAAAA